MARATAQSVIASLALLVLLGPGRADDGERPGLFPAFEKATRLLREIGLPDPKGLEYREVVIRPGTVKTGGGEPIRVHGFVLPAEGEGEPRRALCWNGLVYPVDSVGKAVDLHEDVLRRIREDAVRVENDGWNEHRMPWGDERYGWSERDTLATDRVNATDACLLLLRGERGLAEKARAAWLALADEDDHLFRSEPFVGLARDRLWLLWERAICLHMRGEDRAALAACRDVAAAWKKAREVAKREKILAEFEDWTEPPDQLEAVTADLARRLSPPPPANPLHPRIRDLENVTRVELHGTFGYSIDDPRVQAVVSDESVSPEALIDCLENDDRLSRLVYVHENGDRTALPVFRIAGWALGRRGLRAGNLQSFATKEERRDLAEHLRARLAREREYPGAAWWFEVLSRDDAEEDWLAAAEGIVRREWTPGPMLGESLRGRRGPSVGELLARRMDESVAVGAVARSVTLGEALARWDPARHADDLRTCFERGRRHLAGIDPTVGVTPAETGIARHLTLIAIALDRAGDEAALERWARWFSKAIPRRVVTRSYDALSPLWKRPGHAAVAGVAGWLLGEESPWRGYLEASTRLRSAFAKGLVLSPGVREDVVAALLDARRRDVYAQALRWIEGAPDSTEAMGEFLRRYGERLEFDEFGEVWLAFPALGRAATAEDVAAGRAIFFLTGEARVVALPDRPLFTRVGKRNARVVQVEEDLENGRRWVGLVKRHSLARVPAEEVEVFPWNDGFEPLAGRLQARVGLETGWEVLGLMRVVPSTVELFNPTAYDVEPPAGIAKGVELTLVRAEGPPDREATPWVPVATKRFDVSPGGPLSLAEERRILEIADLHDHFDLGTPGTYRFRVRFPGLPGSEDGVLLPSRIVISR